MFRIKFSGLLVCRTANFKLHRLFFSRFCINMWQEITLFRTYLDTIYTPPHKIFLTNYFQLFLLFFLWKWQRIKGELIKGFSIRLLWEHEMTSTWSNHIHIIKDRNFGNFLNEADAAVIQTQWNVINAIVGFSLKRSISS